MKLALIWKWWAGKTIICVVLINLLQKYKKVIAIDADSNKNLIDYIFNDKIEEKSELWELREEIFKKSEVSKSSYERKYFPKNWIWVFELNQNDKVFQKTAYQKENISLIQLWEPKEKRVWVTWMCPYNETMKVFLSNLKDNDKEIVLVDFAAWSEASTKWIIASFDNLIIPLEPNLKNIDVTKDIFKTLKLINFKNVFFILNKVRSEKDIEFIKSEFWQDIQIIWIIPFSKELMKMDIKKEIDLENKIIKNNFSPIIENILKMWIDKEKLERLKNLDDLKLWKKCH